MSGPGAAADAEKEAQAAENAATAAALAANQAVESATELAAANGVAAAAAVERIAEETNENLSDIEGRLTSWRAEIEANQTNLHSATADRLTTLEASLAQTRQETQTALEKILASLTPPTPDSNQATDPNTPEEPTRTVAPQKSGDGEKDQKNRKGRTILRI